MSDIDPNGYWLLTVWYKGTSQSLCYDGKLSDYAIKHPDEPILFAQRIDKKAYDKMY